MDFEVDRPPPADSSPRDLLITMVEETVIYIYKTVIFDCVFALYRPCAYPGTVLRHPSGADEKQRIHETSPVPPNFLSRGTPSLFFCGPCYPSEVILPSKPLTNVRQIAEIASWPAMRVISLGIRTVPVLSVAKKLAALRPTPTAPAAKCGLIRQDEAD